MKALLLAAVVALTAGPSRTAGDLEREARAIDAALIAPCCFTQQVSLHHSAAADEVKRDVRRRLAAGQSREQILDAYVAQYGKRILAEPPASGFDVTLYVLPFILLFASAATVIVVVRRLTHRAPCEDAVAATALEAGEAARLDDELRNLD